MASSMTKKQFLAAIRKLSAEFNGDFIKKEVENFVKRSTITKNPEDNCQAVADTSYGAFVEDNSNFDTDGIDEAVEAGVLDAFASHKKEINAAIKAAKATSDTLNKEEEGEEE